MTSNIELYLRLNVTERRIVRTTAKMGLTPSTLSVFQLYFPKVTADDLRWLIGEILKFPGRFRNYLVAYGPNQVNLGLL